MYKGENILMDNMLVPKVKVSALNRSVIRLYKESLLEPEQGRLKVLGTEELLLEINAVGVDEDGKLTPTAAGVLMFGMAGDIRKIYPNYFLDYRLLCEENQNKWKYRITSDIGLECGNIFEFYIKALRSLNAHPEIKGTSAERGVKEALANAVIHADYSGRQGIVVKVYDKYLEISNPGNILIGEKQFYEGGISDPRNPLVFQMFARIGMGDRAGNGMRRILEAWKEQAWPQPTCSILDSPRRVELYMSMRK